MYVPPRTYLRARFLHFACTWFTILGSSHRCKTCAFPASVSDLCIQGWRFLSQVFIQSIFAISLVELFCFLHLCIYLLCFFKKSFYWLCYYSFPNFPPLFPPLPCTPYPPAFLSPLNSCPCVVHISSLSSLFPIPFFISRHLFCAY